MKDKTKQLLVLALTVCTLLVGCSSSGNTRSETESSVRSQTESVTTDGNSEKSESSEDVSDESSQLQESVNEDAAKVPDLTDKTKEEAEDVLEAAGFAFRYEEEFSEYTEKGRIIRQSPEAGEEAVKGSIITLYISKGKDTDKSSDETSEESSDKPQESKNSEETSKEESTAPQLVKEIDITSVSLNATDVTLSIGQTFDLDVIIQPANATKRDCVWHWSDNSVIDFNGDGLIRAKAAGELTITVESYNGKTASCRVKVKEKAPEPSQTSQPAPVDGRIVNSFVPYTSATVYRDVNALCSRYPDLLKQFNIGYSAKGKSIPCITMGYGAQKACIVGGIHSREHITISFTMRCIEEMADAFTNGSMYGEYDIASLLNKYTLYIVPMINPDGTDISVAGEGTLFNFPNLKNDSYKLNANGVNLNRNFPFNWEQRFANQTTVPGDELYAGKYAASESETQAIIQLCSENSFNWLLDMHILGGGIYWRDAQNGTIPDDNYLTSAICARCALTQFPITNESANGGLENWFRYKYQRPGLCIELIPSNQSGGSSTYKGYNSYFENAVGWSYTKYIFAEAMRVM